MTWRVPKGAKAAKDGSRSLGGKHDAASAILAAGAGRSSLSGAGAPSSSAVAAAIPNKNVFVRWDGYSNRTTSSGGSGGGGNSTDGSGRQSKKKNRLDRDGSGSTKKQRHS